jgi:REP element-mobilizing transposase RayT
MARARKRRLQQALFSAAGQPLVREGKRIPQKRRRKPGRKPKHGRAGSPHKTRPELKSRFPVHIVLRVVGAVGNLRKRHMYKAFRMATIAVAKRELNDKENGAFRIVHISIQHNHVHLIVEADHKMALARGMQSFQISAAKLVNRALAIQSIKIGLRSGGTLARAIKNRRRGSVFPDRYHAVIITTPAQARHTLAYVLNNWRKHREDRAEIARGWKVDPYSTGVQFEGWKERASAKFYMDYRDTYQPMVVYLAKTWLLCEGWRKHGLIGFREVPSARQLGQVGELAAVE